MERKENIVSLKEHFLALLKEEKESNDHRFGSISQRFDQSEKAVANALANQKELSQTVQKASDTAILKAEESQKQYNVGHNDLSRKMEAQYKDMLPRSESAVRDKNMDEKLAEHTKMLSIINSRLDLIAGRGAGIKDFYGWIAAGVAAGVAAISFFTK